MRKAKTVKTDEELDILDRAGAAELIGISVPSLDLMLRAGQIPSTLHDGRRCFSRTRLIEVGAALEAGTLTRIDLAFEQKALELGYRDALTKSMLATDGVTDMVKRSLAGERVEPALERGAVEDENTAEAEARAALRRLDEFAGFSRWYEKEDADAKAKAAKAKRPLRPVTTYTPDGSGSTTKWTRE